MSRYNKTIINNINQSIQHPDPDLNKKLMNARYNKEGCFYLKIDIEDLNVKSEIVGDAAAGIPALAELIGKTFKKNEFSKDLVKTFYTMIVKYMEEGE